MSEWKEKPLSSIAVINPRESIKKGQIAKKVAMQTLLPFTKKISQYSLEEYEGGMKFRNGDTIVARITPSLENGKTAFVDILDKGEVGFGSTEFIVLREKENESDKHFLYYLAMSPEFRNVAILSMTGSSGRQRVQTNVITDYIFDIPPLPEQKAITAVLSSLDDKIDLLHRQNKTLESLAQTLFRHWFIDNAADDWEDGVIPDEFDFTMGLSPPGNTYNQDKIGTPMFQGNADFTFRFPENRVFTTNPKRFAERLDTLISVRAPVGAQNMARIKCCIGRGVAAFRYKANPKFYTYTYFKLMSLMDEIKQFNNEGTVFGSIGKRNFMEFKLTIPSPEMVKNFQNTAKPIDDKVIANCEEIKTLEKLRDTLLPKLMSGAVRVHQN